MELKPIPKIKTKPWDHQKEAFWFIVQLWGGLPEKEGSNDDTRNSV